MQVLVSQEKELYSVFQQGVPSKFLSSNRVLALRGSNFQQKCTLFTDESNNCWLLKDLRFKSLLNEYIVSILAQEIGVSIPRSVLVRNSHSYALMQQYLEDSVELIDDPHFHGNKGRIILLLIFESWIGALDRHSGNYLTVGNRLWAIDFEQCFSSSVNGSELTTFFPWLRDIFLQDDIDNFKSKITIERILELKEEILKISDLVTDDRAKHNVINTIIDIFDLLIDNYSTLEDKVTQYLVATNVLLDNFF